MRLCDDRTLSAEYGRREDDSSVIYDRPCTVLYDKPVVVTSEAVYDTPADYDTVMYDMPAQDSGHCK